MVVGLRTVSSLSTESSTNSVSSTDGFTTSPNNNNNNNNNMVIGHQLHQQLQLTNPTSVCSIDGFSSSVQDALSRINQSAFDEVSQN